MSGTLVSQAVTHPGAVRPRNEDTFVDRSDIGLWAVADGAGGHGAGDVASAAIAEALVELPAGLNAAELLAQVRLRLSAVHADLKQRAASGSRRIIASTVVVQELVESGLIDADDAEAHPQANVITRAVGADGELELDKVSARFEPGDLFLLCSDGLFKALPEAEIAACLAAGEGAEGLLAAALARGARDNVTAVAVRVE